MWGAIIQAIDHAAGRTASAGKQAQSGAAVGGQTGLSFRDIKNIGDEDANEKAASTTTQESTPAQKSETPVAQNAPGSNQASGASGDTNDGTGGGGESGGANPLGNLSNIGNLGSEGGEGAASVAGGVTSDEKAKVASKNPWENWKGKSSDEKASVINDQLKQRAEGLTKAASNAQQPASIGQHSGFSFNRYSDENLKRIFGENCPIDCFARINSYVFKYKPEVRAALAGKNGIDDDVHFGVMAQELEQNPFTRSTVHTDPETGFKTVDTQELTMANTAAISDIMKELQELRSFKKAVVSAMIGGK